MLEVNYAKGQQASALEVEMERMPRVWPLLGPMKVAEAQKGMKREY